ncbi:hypothetical protein HCN44_010235 [Aphidius gifuensis]|uniref:Gustatory receptor n=1 Tax=Aphidius gifuensis TaxID=684658 RepID=A0A834XWR3_APHGI|nr:hypothetical protein HCN44_010235 [Aphidius gifuensis]
MAVVLSTARIDDESGHALSIFARCHPSVLIIEVISLSLQFNSKLKHIQKNSIGRLKNLKQLALSYNSIESIENGAFSKLNNRLSYLDLSQNKLQALSDKVFEGIMSVDHLDLSNNNIIHFKYTTDLSSLVYAYNNSQLFSVNGTEKFRVKLFCRIENWWTICDNDKIITSIKFDEINPLWRFSDKQKKNLQFYITIDNITSIQKNAFTNIDNQLTIKRLVYAYNNSQLFSVRGSKKIKVKLFCRIENWWTICINDAIATSITLNQFDSTLQLSDEEKKNFQMEISIDNITSIRNDAWKNIDTRVTIKSLILNKNIRDGLKLSSNSFDGLSKLENLELNVGLTVLEHGAFYRLTELTRLKIEVNGTKQYLDYKLFAGIICSIIRTMATFTWNFCDLLIILVSIGLAERYKHLNEIVRFKILNNSSERINWREIKNIYTMINELVKEADDIVSPLILLSCCMNVYQICVQTSEGIRSVTTETKTPVYYFLSLFVVVFRTMAVVLSTAKIDVESGQALSILARCHPSVFIIEVR